MSKMTITVPFEDVTKELYLKENVADGDWEGEPFILDREAITNSPMIQFRGRVYLINSHMIVEAVLGQITEGEDHE